MNDPARFPSGWLPHLSTCDGNARMTILFAASEVAPSVCTGGLGEVIGSLPRFLTHLGHEVAVALPGYTALLEGATDTGVRFSVPIGATFQTAEVFERIAPNGTQWLLIRNDALFARAGLYGNDQGPFEDNSTRFIFFSKAVVELARRIQPAPQILHLNDWHTALAPVLVREQRLPLKTVLTIHNVQHQGLFWGVDFPLTNLPSRWFSPDSLEFFGQLNLLKGGVLAADLLTTGSATYRAAILSEEKGSGLHGALRSRAHALYTVPHGVDPEVWNPALSETAVSRFSSEIPGGKAFHRDALLEEAGLRSRPKGPVYLCFAKLSENAVYEALMPLVPRLLASDSRLLIIGDAPASSRMDLLAALRQHPQHLAFFPDWHRPHFPRWLAGADLLLAPPSSDPSDLLPLYALPYGTIPIASASPMLLERLHDYDPTIKQGNALLYHRDSPQALWECTLRAFKLFQNPTHWEPLLRNAMLSEFPWERAAQRYDELYRSLLY